MDLYTLRKDPKCRGYSTRRLGGLGGISNIRLGASRHAAAKAIAGLLACEDHDCRFADAPRAREHVTQRLRVGVRAGRASSPPASATASATCGAGRVREERPYP